MQDLVYVIQCDSLATPDFHGRWTRIAQLVTVNNILSSI